ncbi:MAG: phosphatase PAP2 family protein [Ruminococcaceae bacterium]|nr:phosphatase PAP2 family protein [Oscillospiraceae bacterium]
MELLRVLETIRTPFFDTFFSLLTKLGEETVLLLIALFLVWCVDKKHGYHLFAVGFFGLTVNQFLKMTTRVPRPWVKDPSFTIVESARAGATGYSFPSGHTQVSVSLYGSMARFCKSRAVRIVSLLLAILIPFSRLYLGVHTLADVLASVVIATTLIFVIHPIIYKNFENKKAMNLLFSAMALSGLAYVLYITYFPFPTDVDTVHLADAAENGYKMFGAILGLWVSYLIDLRYIRFDTKAVWWAQMLKFILGAVFFLILRMALKALLPSGLIFGAVRYFLLVIYGMTLWPMTFKYFPQK